MSEIAGLMQWMLGAFCS